MGVKIKILTLSYLRPDRVLVNELVPGIPIVTRPEEADAYAANYPNNEIIPLSKGVKGLVPTRQWIYEKFGNVFMLDDDITKCMRRYEYGGQKVDNDEVPYIIDFCGNMAKLAGAYIFGFSSDPSPLNYRPQMPLHTHGVVNGCAFGMLAGSGLAFDPKIVAADDYYMCALNAYYHRYLYIDTRYHFLQKETLVAKGGMQAYRTVETEKQDTLFLRKTFGECIQRKRENHGSGMKGAKTTTKNEFGRIVSFPY